MVDQASYRRNFNFKTFQNRSQIFKLDKNFEAHASCKDHWAISSSPSGSPITVQTLKNVITTLHAAFNITFNWLLDIWNIYSLASLDIFGSCKWLQILKCYPCMFQQMQFSLLCQLWSLICAQSFCFNNCEKHCTLNINYKFWDSIISLLFFELSAWLFWPVSVTNSETFLNQQ